MASKRAPVRRISRTSVSSPAASRRKAVTSEPLGIPARGTTVAWAIATLRAGPHEQREDVIARLTSLPPGEKARYRVQLLKQLEDQAPQSRSSASGTRENAIARGWYLQALVTVRGDDKRATDVVLRHLDPKRERDEWVRYWVVAQEYWSHGAQAAAEIVRTAGTLKDHSLLVRTLAEAIGAVALGRSPDTSALRLRDLARTFACLRALQVVSTAATVPALLAFLRTRTTPPMIYEAMRALTATPGTTREANRILPRSLPAAELVERIATASKGSRPALKRRFAELTRDYPQDSIRVAVQEAIKRGQHDFEELMQPLPPLAAPDPGVALPAGAWRAELAYRAVLHTPAQFDLLESLSPAQLLALARGASLPLTGASDATLAEHARSTAKGDPANLLWLAWIKNVHAAKLSQS